MVKKTKPTKAPGVGFYGKVRIGTIGHLGAINTAKDIAQKTGGKLTIGLSGTSAPLTPEMKRQHAERLFGHPVMSGNEPTRTLSSFLSHMSKKHDELHMVAGSDRAEEYRRFLERYNGKPDRKGNVPFNFKSWKVHEYGAPRMESDKDPTKMNSDELVQTVSATKLEQLANSGKWEQFRAYHPGMPLPHVRKLYAAIRQGSGLKEQVDIGLPMARSEMPQLGAAKSFVKYLKDNDVASVRKKVDPNTLKSSQMEFDDEKIMGLRAKPSSNPIVVSNDGHVLDGHHRWLADKEEGRQCDAFVCDMPILDLMHKAKHYCAVELNEEVSHKELAPMLDSFVSFASDKLGIKSLPKVRFKTDEDGYNSFAAYSPSENELSVHTKNRHPMDVFRSVAHELVHHKQNEEGRIGKNIAKEGDTGSDIENEANAEAGKIMRWFAKANPDYFSKSQIVEDHAANHASSGEVRGMGYVSGDVSPTGLSPYITSNIEHTEKLKASTAPYASEEDEDYAMYKNMKMGWSDHPSDQILKQKSFKTFRKTKLKKETLQEGIYDPGKLKAVFLAGGPGSGKDFVMKSVLDGNGLREINSDNAFEFLMNKEGLDLQMPDEERLQRDIVRGTAQTITKSKQRMSLAGRQGLIINGTAANVEETAHIKKLLERLGYETMMVFVNTSDEVSRQRNVDRGKQGKRKVPDGTDKFGVADGSKNIRKEKWDAAQKNIGAFQELFGADKFSVIDNTSDQRKLEGEEKEKVLASFNNVRRMVHQFVNTPNSNAHAHNWINREVENRGITDYAPPRAARTLQQFRQIGHVSLPEKPDNGLMAQARRLGLSYYGFGRFGRKMNGKNTVMYKEKDGRLQRAMYEDVDMDQLFENVVVEGKDTHKMEWGTDYLRKDYEKNTPGSTKKMKKKVVAQETVASPTPFSLLPDSEGVGPEFPAQRQVGPLGYTSPISESIVAWVNNPKTQAKFAEKYGKLAEQKLQEAAMRLEQCGCGQAESKIKKSVKKIYEASAAWTRKEGQNPEGGLNKKGVASYRAANPGSKLQTAVTTEPSKLKKGGKKAKRRLSFCRRMKGMKSKLTSAKTARDPDSRINKSLRKWNCEE